ncbi:MAG: xanthine dehydrogenase family protein molybdopterin-binding subunit, partial [Candidatus Marinimicrobia bacterium]|nr:xanthine dehydrogenase family protein molybdopterin-binding subunit [Candidatus Neomarinimicrobiota bacterium]
FPLDKIKVNVTLLGGGFGRRAFNDFVTEAVQISKKAGKPVKLIWTREDDIHHDYYRPASKHILQGGFDINKRLIAWSHRIIAPSIIFSEYITFPIPFKEKLDRVALHGAKDLPYTIPNILIDYKMANTAIPVGWWRSVYHSQNAFAPRDFLTVSYNRKFNKL